MADRVDRVLERDLNGLDTLRKHGIISDAELRSIINRRREFEYKLHRRAPIVSDFQRAIQYETNLYNLVQLRISRQALKNSDQLLSSIRRREFGIYQRMVGKFPGDPDLWAAFLDYARDIGARKALSNAIAKALQLHPLRPKLWVKAMAFEYDINNSIDVARVLMQRALRMLPKSPVIWLAFFKMEVQYARRLDQRAKLSNSDVDVKMEIPLLLYRRAIETAVHDWRFRIRFLQLLPDGECNELRDQIKSDLATGFSDNTECMEILDQIEKSNRECNETVSDIQDVSWCIDTCPSTVPVDA